MTYDDRLEIDIKRYTNNEPTNWYEVYSNVETYSLPDAQTKREALDALIDIIDYYTKAYCDVKDTKDDDE